MTQPVITLYSSFYGHPEPFNPKLFGDALGKYKCVVFTDNPKLDVPDNIDVVLDPLCGLDPNRASRRAKLMPHRYLQATNWSIYIDNNAIILVDPNDLIKLLQQSSAFLFATKHPVRNCTYLEAEACVHAKKDSPEKIQQQMNLYRSLGFPENRGLIHGGFVVRRHDHPICQDFGERWFEHVLAYSRRDQLAVKFLAWEMDVDIEYLPTEIGGSRIFHWPVFDEKKRRDTELVRKNRKSPMLKIFTKLFRRSRMDGNSVARAEGLAKEIYTKRLGSKHQEDLDGATLLKYEKDGVFDYETYKEIQSEGNRLKFDCQWVGQDQIDFLCGLIKKYGSIENKFGICHGTRSGNEQLWFSECLGAEVSVIGTDIAENANEIPKSIQWDFHEENPDWEGRADFVYSNSWDHSYNPGRAFKAWIKSLRPGGLLLIDWSQGHSEKGVTEMDPFGATLEYLQNMFIVDFKDLGDVIATVEGQAHGAQKIYTVVFRKADPDI